MLWFTISECICLLNKDGLSENARYEHFKILSQVRLVFLISVDGWCSVAGIGRLQLQSSLQFSTQTLQSLRKMVLHDVMSLNTMNTQNVTSQALHCDCCLRMCSGCGVPSPNYGCLGHTSRRQDRWMQRLLRKTVLRKFDSPPVRTPASLSNQTPEWLP